MPLTSFHSKNFSNTGYFIVIEKTKHRLTLFSGSEQLGTTTVVFGSDDMTDKMQQGDRKTPEGIFTIVNKRVHEKWDRFLLLDYPRKEDYEKFKQRKAAGLIPENAAIGGGIGIHGTWPHEDYVIAQNQNWTEGCISMHNKDVEKLYDDVPVGTKVYIRK